MERFDCYDRVKELTRSLVMIPSINKEPGQETAVAQYIHGIYREMPYFQDHPDQLELHATRDDFVSRHNVMAWVKGTKGTSNRAVVLIGHIDTVGIDDYGTIREYACNPDVLPEKLMTLNMPQSILDDIKSGQFMFGRGALDMKSGVAGHMALMEYFSAHPEELDGVLIALHECDEEDGAHGMMTGIDRLIQLKEDMGLEYLACINADYSTNYSPGDESRYIYYGCIGKVLPCFYAFGKETHVGQAFAGLDPNLLLSRIMCDLSLNVDFSDVAMGEVAIPPISLKLADTKVGYTVQTALTALAYFNAFTHSWTPGEVLDKCVTLAKESFDKLIADLNDQYRRFCQLSSIDYLPLPWRTKVLTWEEFYNRIRARRGKPFEDAIAAFAKTLEAEQPELDMRLFSCRILDEAWKWETDKSPCVVVFFGSAFHTHSSVTREDVRGAALLDAVEAAVERVRPLAQRDIKTRMFYPYIADTSFIAAPKGDVLPAIQENMPSWGVKYTYELDKIRQVDMPVVNIGSFGRDGHMLTERVDMKHTFENVPNISYHTIAALLG